MKLLAVQLYQERYHRPKVRIGEDYRDIGMNFVWKKVVARRSESSDERWRNVEWRTRVFRWPTDLEVLERAWRWSVEEWEEYDGGELTDG